MPLLPNATPVLLPVSGLYVVSCDLTGVEEVTLLKRSGESGALRPVHIAGTPVTLTASYPSAQVYLGGSEYVMSVYSDGGGPTADPLPTVRASRVDL